MSKLRWLLDRPAWACIALALAQCLVWTLAPALTHTAPPLDVVEGYLWGKEWVIGTYKHPGLPGWVLEASRQLTGAIGWPAYLASQLFIAATLLFVFMLGREIMGGERALAGTLLLTGVFYFAWPSIEFNHNVAQMPFWAGMAWTLWKARGSGETLWWVLLGALGAESLYAKLSSGLFLLAAAGWILLDPPLRRQLLRPAPYIGLGVFLIIVTPLVVWLIRTDFIAITYMSARGAGSAEAPISFLGAQVLAAFGLLAMLVVGGLHRRPAAASAPDELPAVPAAGIRYLAYMTFVPVLLPIGLALAVGSGLKSMWGMPMLALAGLLAIALAGSRYSRAALERIARAAAVLLVVAPVGYAIDTLWETTFTGQTKRQNWPQAEISERLTRRWVEDTGKPLEIVAGERWVAGIVALSGGPMPSILTLGELALSPWITPERLRAQGALVVWLERPDLPNPPPYLATLVGRAPVGRETFAQPRFPNAAPLVIGYAILRPGEAAAATAAPSAPTQP